MAQILRHDPKESCSVESSGEDGVLSSPFSSTDLHEPRVLSEEIEEESEAEEARQWLQLPIPTSTHETLPVDERDLHTPDNWVPRPPSLIRLTGKHPFNCEAPLSSLMAGGAITPVDRFFVRNHGAVPRLDWSTWRVEVCGLVRRPLSLSMADILALPSRTLPVTLCCSGNRRKEVNAVKQSRGYNWGAAGVSTAVWKGALLCDVLQMCGILPASHGAVFINCEGAETLPGGGGSPYGTSLRRSHALDPSLDVLLAYEQNGRPLAPDHGFPLRLIIPGFISGRMVKWLRRIEVSSEESSSYYWFHDNRVLPPHVDDEATRDEAMWRDPSSVITELNVNSAICQPDHGQQEEAAEGKTLRVAGYAYSGGGRQVTRVELSLDGGGSWRPATLLRPIPPTRFGRHWCWQLWEARLAAGDLLGGGKADGEGNSPWKQGGLQGGGQASAPGGEGSVLGDGGEGLGGVLAGSRASVVVCEIAVRAWDSSCNTQPERLTWNILGMMNNCWYRVRVHRTTRSDGSAALRFEHPTQPGAMPGGWMFSDLPVPLTASATLQQPTQQQQRKKEAAEKLRETPLPSARLPAQQQRLRKIPMSEVARHASEESCWIVVHGKVYDPTPFLKDHPGGAQSVLTDAGADATEDFDAIHDESARAMLQEYLIGELGEEESAAQKEEEAGEGPGEAGADANAGATGREGQRRAASAASVEPQEQLPAGAEQTAAVQMVPHLGAAPASGPIPVLVDQRRKIRVPLVARTALSHDSYRLRFALPSKQHVLGLPVGQHLFLFARCGGRAVVRPYTPTSPGDTRGYFELVVKVYRATEGHPQGGLMSQHLEAMRLGDTIDIKGPVGEIVYQGRGHFSVSKRVVAARHLALLAGGTGITPMFQIIQAIVRDQQDGTAMSLLFANKTPQDILLRAELEALAAETAQLRVWYTVDRDVPPDWPYGVGFVNADMARKHLPPAGDEALALVCGPPGFVDKACVPTLQQLGYNGDRILKF